MLSENYDVFKKQNLDFYLKELAKEYKKAVGKNMPAEVILVGGAAILANYGFRDMTTDIDAVIVASSAMKDAINRIGDRYGLPNGWLNMDFQKTSSYSVGLLQHSLYYKSFKQVLDVRVVTAEYLIAMKLRAYRPYKNDLSDIIGILYEHEKLGDPITFARIDTAVTDLYGTWVGFPDGAKDFIESALLSGDYEKVYGELRKNEEETRSALLDFQDQNPGDMKEESIDMVLRKLRDIKRQIGRH